MRIYVRMILAYGFFQADPHPGNLFVRPDGQIVLLDFGLAKDLPPGFGLGMFELMFSMMTLNEAAMLKALRAARLRAPRRAIRSGWSRSRGAWSRSPAGASRASSPRT